MFKKYQKQLIISSIAILLPIVFGLVMWNRLPDSFTIHWGVDGQPDGFSSKGFAVFFIPVFLLLMQFFCLWITDKTNRHNQQSPKVMNMLFFIMPAVSLLVNGIGYAAAMGKIWDVNSLMPIILGALFTVIGNYMPKCTRNTTVGIKVKWTLENEENWNATHRFAGKTWVAGGLVTVFSVFLPTSIGYPIMILALFVAGFGSILYSWLYHRKQLKAGTASPADPIPMDKTSRAIARGGIVIGIAILIFCGFILFSGSIRYEFREDALVMDATFYPPINLRYETVEDVQYRYGNVDGVRIGGFGSFKLLLGFFENEEFGPYSRYTYYKPDGCIIITTKDDILVLSGRDAAETKELYYELLTRIP